MCGTACIVPYEIIVATAELDFTSLVGTFQTPTHPPYACSTVLQAQNLPTTVTVSVAVVLCQY